VPRLLGLRNLLAVKIGESDCLLYVINLKVCDVVVYAFVDIVVGGNNKRIYSKKG
jgi:hypothetical protein